MGSCFYHKYEYIASDHITALTSEHADEYIYKFMSTVIRRLEEKYYMSNFIKNLEKENLEKTLEHIYIYI